MRTIFPKWANALPAVTAVGGAGASVLAIAGITYYWTPSFWEVGYKPEQPVAFSHQIHVGKLGIDCRYCHTHVEVSSHSNVPDTATCMACHQGDVTTGEAYLNNDLWNAHKDNPHLTEIRSSYATDEPVAWKRIHKLPDYAHFNHAVHVNAGVSCYSCHGRVDHQEVAYQVHSLGMGWCLDCHRNPEEHLVDVDGVTEQYASDPFEVTDLRRVEEQLASSEQEEIGLKLAAAKQIQPPQHCGACHY